MMLYRFRFHFLGILLGGCIPIGLSAQEGSLSATDLLAKVRRVYLEVPTYMDEVTAERANGDVPLDRCEFRTHFVRLKSIRFESKCRRILSADHRVMLDVNGVTQVAEVTPNGVKTERVASFDDARPASSVYSIGYGPAITKLLMSELSGNPLLPLDTAQMRPDEKIGEIPVYVVAGTWRGADIILKIDKSRLLILEIVEIDSFASFVMRKVFRIRPTIPEVIPDSHFRLPPIISPVRQ